MAPLLSTTVWLAAPTSLHSNLCELHCFLLQACLQFQVVKYWESVLLIQVVCNWWYKSQSNSQHKNDTTSQTDLLVQSNLFKVPGSSKCKEDQCNQGASSDHQRNVCQYVKGTFVKLQAMYKGMHDKKVKVEAITDQRRTQQWSKRNYHLERICHNSDNLAKLHLWDDCQYETITLNCSWNSLKRSELVHACKLASSTANSGRVNLLWS